MLRFGNATERRLEVTVRTRKAADRAAREARRRAGIAEPTVPYRPHKPWKKAGLDYRSFYPLKLQAGLALALLLVIGAVNAPLRPRGSEVEYTLADQEVILLEEIVQTRQNQPPPPPPRPPVPIEVPNDVILENDELGLDATLDVDEIFAELPPPPPPAEEEEETEPEIFVVVEDPPVMIGGLASIMQHVRYPELARKAGIEGRVTVQFVVDENGDVQDPVVVRGVGAGCDEEALRVVRLAKFEPGKQRGRAVKVRMSTSVNFRLTSS